MAFIFFTVGEKGSGKSLFESRRALRIMNGYYDTEAKYPKLKKRIYFSKQKFAERIEKIELHFKMKWNDKYDEETKTSYSEYIYDLDENGNRIVLNKDGHLFYWSDVYELKNCPREDCWKGKEPHRLHNADIFWDEIGNDLPPESWAGTPSWLRQIFSHARKRGLRVFANAQKYEMTEVHFRQQVDIATWVRKLFGSRDIDVTLPDPKRVWVLQYVRHFDPLDIENENDPRNLEALTLWDWPWRRFRWYTRKDVEVYDTMFEIPPWKSNLVHEVHYNCVEGDKCTDPKGRWRSKHVKY